MHISINIAPFISREINTFNMPVNYQLIREKELEVLGHYISGHPLLEHSEDIEEFTTISFGEDIEISKNDIVYIGGMITRITNRYDRRNREMAFFPYFSGDWLCNSVISWRQKKAFDERHKFSGCHAPQFRESMSSNPNSR